ncbi:Mbeg1-like protein [Eubacterium sp. 1001713B170207_170306_E7]|uniref:Mbeg1-like protein n=1 Tax=Eubacterium sp. 1001713B170207_170306_E7 TaxID=2787097 RepID=UPI00189A4F6D|nr:Mbeg1-like protein [Eubacterium sp. 1001713B170207_170306_E7]
MSNIFDYLDWRGDLTLDQSPFNAVDNLILSCISYIRLEGIVPNSTETVSIAAVSSRFFALPEDERQLRLRVEEDGRLLKALACTRRFADMGLCLYDDQLDPVLEKQFCGLTILTGDGLAFIAYRGTDNTLVGWKEDFNMSFKTCVPSQTEAAEYLKRAAGSLGAVRLRIGGHSKGGNLAVYAGIHSGPYAGRIEAIYSNDGPGFPAEVLESPAYQDVISRIRTFVPQTSIVGMLLEHAEDYTVVHSRQIGIAQHDPYSWEILGPNFVCLESVTAGCRFMDETVKAWVDDMTPGEREQFIDTFYDILCVTQAQTVGDLAHFSLKNARAIKQTLENTDPETKKMMTEAISKLLEAARESFHTLLPHKKASD